MIVYHGTTMEIQKADWDEERTLKEISYYKKNDQIAFLTQEIIDGIVAFKESYEVKS